MVQPGRTFRIFVSSTFTDMRVERGILQSDVFPRLKKFCEERGALFQAIDLRYGVNEESQREQKTMEICLTEIARCQRLSPRPNFIVLLGDRYGWQPIPNNIPFSEMAELLRHFSDEEKKQVTTWYKEDTNAIPSEYVLQPWGAEYKDYRVWQAEEDKLRKILRKAVGKTDFSDGQRTNYFASATHQEIIKGALMPSAAGVNPTGHVFTYLRTIDNLPQDKSAGEFVDLMPDGTVAPYAKKKMAGLKKELENKLLKEHIYLYHSQWNEVTQSDEKACTEMDTTGDNGTKLKQLQFDEKAFAGRVYENLTSVIERELKEIIPTDELTKEKNIHTDFRDRLTKFFIGREDTLRYISSYLEKGSGKPLALIGTSGSGKSSIMAKALKGTGEGVKIFRFIGVTSSSSNLNSLLSQVCDEIVKAYNVELKSLLQEGEDEMKLTTYEGLKEIFARCVNLASEEYPLLIFLDALDQLQTPKYDFLNIKLPDHARIIISALPGLEEKLTFADIFMLPLMKEDDGRKLLEMWLLSEKRKLMNEQREEIIGKFKENGLPIYLKLAFEQARKWHSYDKPKSLPKDVKGILAEYFDLLEKAHTKELVSKATGYLLSGKYGGLTESEILDILAFDDEYWQGFLKSCHPAHREEVEKAGKLPAVVWSRLYFDLEPYLSERDADGIKIMAFYHSTFGEYARKRYLRHHVTLAYYFEKEPHEFFEDEEQRIPNYRKMSELPFQIVSAEMLTELLELLEDIKFWQIRSLALNINAVSDYRTWLCFAEAGGRPLSIAQKRNGIFQYLWEFGPGSKCVTVEEPDCDVSTWLVHRTGIYAATKTNVYCILRSSGKTLLRQSGHMGQITDIMVSDSGNRIITAAKDGTVRVMDAATGVNIATLHGISTNTSLLLSPDGHLLLQGSENGIVYSWVLDTGVSLRTQTVPRPVLGLALLPSGRVIWIDEQGQWEEFLQFSRSRPSSEPDWETIFKDIFG